MLIPDHRGSDEQQTAYFDLAPTEKKYFKFLELREVRSEHRLAVRIITDVDPTGMRAAILGEFKYLTFGKKYSMMVAAHGKGARSRRINLIVDADRETEVIIMEARPQNRKELERT